MIRQFTKEDMDDVLEILRLNTPEFFDVSEEADLIAYLNHKLEDYFVIERQGAVVGAGGINYFEAEKTARLSWDMIHPTSQGMGLGGQLVAHRITQIKKNNAIKTVAVRTTQLVHKFYAKFGFELKEVVKDYWATGFDLYHMEINLS